MSFVNLDLHDRVAVIRLNNGVTNAIHPKLVSDLRHAVTEVKTNARGLVLAGGPKFFSIGFDLPWVLQATQEELLSFYQDFNDTCLEIYSLPLPTAAAVIGHAPAGGTILATACDYRYLAAGKPRLGLNEVQIGVSIPYLAHLLLRQITGDRAATDMTYTGRLVDPEKALAVGLADKLLSPEDVESKALEKISSLADLPGEAFAQVKAVRIENIRRLYLQNGRASNEKDIGLWMDPEVRKLLAKAAEKY